MLVCSSVQLCCVLLVAPVLHACFILRSTFIANRAAGNDEAADVEVLLRKATAQMALFTSTAEVAKVHVKGTHKGQGGAESEGKGRGQGQSQGEPQQSKGQEACTSDAPQWFGFACVAIAHACG